MTASPLPLTKAAATLLGERESHRSTVLYSLESQAGELRPAGARRGTPVAELFSGAELDLYRRWHYDARDQLPRVRHHRLWPAEDVWMPSASSLIEPFGAQTWLLEMPSGGLVAGLTVDYRFAESSQELRPCPELFRDIDAGRYDLRLGGGKLLEICLSDLGEEETRPTWGADIHHLLFAAPGSVAQSMQLDRGLAQRLISRRDDESRADFLTVRLPREANRLPGFLCAVSPGASAVAGHPPEVELAFTISAASALAALSSLRSSQRRAYDALAQLRAPAPAGAPPDTTDRRRELNLRLEDLADLELEMSFGVEAYLDLRLLVPSMPVVEFHHELVEALGLPRSAAVTSKMLSRLSQGIAAEADEIAAEERAADERRWRTWSAVGGLVAGVAVPLSLIFGFLGITASQVDRDASIFDLQRYGAYYAVLIGLVVLAVLGGRAYVVLQYRTGGNDSGRGL